MAYHRPDLKSLLDGLGDRIDRAREAAMMVEQRAKYTRRCADGRAYGDIVRIQRISAAMSDLGYLAREIFDEIRHSISSET